MNSTERYFHYRSMTINGMHASHIVHFFRWKMEPGRPAPWQEWPNQAEDEG